MGRNKKPRRHAGQAVKGHPLYEEILELARSGCSPDWILRVLERQHKAGFEAGTMPALPNRRTLYRWRKEQMPERLMFPPRLLEEKLASVERKVDMLKQLQELYSVAEDRLVRLLAVEEKMNRPLPGLDKAIGMLLKVGEQLWRVGQDLGLYPRQPGPALAMGLKEGGPRGGMVLLQLGKGPPRQIDLRSPDLSGLSQDELDALRGMEFEGSR